MQAVEVKFGDWIQRGFDVYKDNAGILILASLIASVLSVLTFFVLAGPMAVGMILITLALIDKRDPKPKADDVFKGFSYFLQSFLFFISIVGVSLICSKILSIIPCIGPVLGTLLSMTISTLTMFTLFHIAERNMDFVPAAKASIEVVKSNFWPFLGFCAVAGVIGCLGMIACGIGIFVTMPITTCILGVAYREIHGGVSQPPAV